MNSQLALAMKFGYVESVGGTNVRKGDLVPYDDESSSLDSQTIEKLKEARYEVGTIYPKK